VTAGAKALLTPRSLGNLFSPRMMDAYIDYWADNPDHFRSLYSMAGTIEDR
jgi:hypothetical protein